MYINRMGMASEDGRKSRRVALTAPDGASSEMDRNEDTSIIVDDSKREFRLSGVPASI